MSVALRYINRELLAIFFVTLILLLLVAVGGRFIGYLQEAAQGKFTGATVLTIMGLRLSEFVQIVAPFSVYVAIVLTLGRLHADQEMVVLQGAGSSTGRVLGWVSATLIGVTFFVAILAWFITPMSQRELVDFMTQQRAQTEFETVNPGTFHIYDRGRRVTYSGDMSADRRVLMNVFMEQSLEDGRRITVWAESGRQALDERTGAHFLVLSNGRRYESSPGSADLRIMSFTELSQRLETISDGRRRDFAVEAQPFSALGDDPESRAEWHWRMALPLFALIGGLLAVGISKVKPRQGRFARVVPGMLLMLLYYLALLMNRSALMEGQLPGVFGLWLVHGAFVGIAVYLLKRVALPVNA